MPRITAPFTPLFHELTEPMMRLSLNGTQFRILLWTARNSYGYGGAKFAAYSWGKIANAIGADRSRISREGRALIEMGVLLKGPGDGKIGICKGRIAELGGVRKRTGGADSPRANQTRQTVSKTHPLSYEEKKKESSAPFPDAQRLTARFEALLKRNGVRRIPDRVAALAAADRLLRSDEVPLVEAIAVLEFAANDPFWKQHVLSLDKFVEKFEQLRLAMEGATAKSAANGQVAPSMDVSQLSALRRAGGLNA